MRAYRVPGVYFEWLDSRLHDIDVVRTDVAAFIGIAARGPIGTAVRVESWAQFVSIFGSHLANSFLAYAAEGFFTNRGQTCWIVRVADSSAKPGSVDIPAAGLPVMTLSAASPGT